MDMSEEATLVRPYVHLLGARDPAEVLRETPGKLADLLKPLSLEVIETKPAPGKWSIRELLCHLADCELVWAWRLRMIYGSTDDPNGPLLQTFDQDLWSRAYDGPGYTTSAARATWSAMRQWNLALIEGFAEEDKRRPASHPDLGPVTLGHIVEIAAGHDLHHLAGIEELTRPMSTE